MLKEVRDENAAEMVVRKLGVKDVRDNGIHATVVGSLRVLHLIDRPALGRRYGIDELTASCCRVKNAVGAPQLLVDERCNLTPHSRAGVLVDIAEAILVKSLIVHKRAILWALSDTQPTH